VLLSFVIPVLNEAESIPLLIPEIISNVNGHDYQIIIVDDGSTDDSFTVLASFAAKDSKIQVIRFRRNFGKAAALQTGFRYAKGDIIFTMDADLQDNPAEISSFVEKYQQGYDLVSGWKKKRFDPWHKTLPSKLFNYVTAKSFRLKLRDYNCGFKAYTPALIKELNLYGEMHRYIPALAHSLGYRIAEIPVQHRARQHGKSKYGIERYLRGFFDLLTVKMVTQYSKSPLYLFGRIGLSAMTMGFLITLYLTFLKVFFHQPLYNRPLLFLGILLILSGLQFFSMGLLSELMINRTSQRNHTMISIRDYLNVEKKDERDLQA